MRVQDRAMQVRLQQTTLCGALGDECFMMNYAGLLSVVYSSKKYLDALLCQINTRNDEITHTSMQ